MSESNGRGRKPTYSRTVALAVLKCRELHPTSGPNIIRYRLIKHPEKYGLHPGHQIPSASTITRLLRKCGLAYKPVGRGDGRSLPFDLHEDHPGTFIVDGWGPWNIYGKNIYTVNAIDAKTRLAISIPAVDLQLGDSRRGSPTATTNRSWALAIEAARQFLLPPSLRMNCVQVDNGVNMAPMPFNTMSGGWNLTLPARLVLWRGATLRFINPATPQHNGRVERWQWTCEREYWRTIRPNSWDFAAMGLVDWVNYYNLERPHRRFDYTPPGQHALSGLPLPYDFWTDVGVPESLPPQYGVIEAIRMVLNNGMIDLWNHCLYVPAKFGGQYVRVKFFVTGEISEGVVMWRRRRGEEYRITHFMHCMDVPHKLRGNRPLIFDVVHLMDEPLPLPKNQNLDEELYANRLSRVLKRRAKLEDELQERMCKD